MKLIVDYNNQQQVINFKNFNYKVISQENNQLILRIMNIKEEYDFNEKILLYDLYNILNVNTITNIQIYSFNNRLLFDLQQLKYNIINTILREDVDIVTHSQAFLDVVLNKE